MATILLGLLLLAHVPTVSGEAKWNYLGQHGSQPVQAVYFVDTTSVRRVSTGDRVWALKVFSRRAGDELHHIKEEFELDCELRRHRSIRTSVTTWSGRVTDWPAAPTDWSFTRPDTFAQRVARFVCGRTLTGETLLNDPIGEAGRLLDDRSIGSDARDEGQVSL